MRAENSPGSISLAHERSNRVIDPWCWKPFGTERSKQSMEITSFAKKPVKDADLGIEIHRGGHHGPVEATKRGVERFEIKSRIVPNRY